MRTEHGDYNHQKAKEVIKIMLFGNSKGG